MAKVTYKQVRVRGEQPIAGKVVRSSRAASGLSEHHGRTKVVGAAFSKTIYETTPDGKFHGFGSSGKNPFKPHKVDNKVIFPGGGSPNNKTPKSAPRARGGTRTKATGATVKSGRKLVGW